MTEPKKPEADAPADETPKPTDEAVSEKDIQDAENAKEGVSGEESETTSETLADEALSAAETEPEKAPDTEETDTPDSIQDEIAEEALHDAEQVERAPRTEADIEADEVVDVPEQAVAAAEQAPQDVIERVVETRGGVVPGFIGGLVAAVGAVFAAPYVLPENMRPVTSLEPVQIEVAAVAETVAGVSARVDGVASTAEAAAPAAELAALRETLAGMQSETTAQIDALRERIDAQAEQVTAQIDEMMRAPVENTDNPEMVAALEAFRREVEAVKGQVEEQTAANARLIEEAASATAAAQAAAEAEAAAAQARAAAAAQQQALVDVQAAIEAGAPFAESLGALSGLDIPEALSSVAETGVATLAALQADFADPAREALDAARRATMPDAPTERGMTFLQRQLGVRSLAPQDGDSPDAVLSRAEAAARNGDLTGAVTELAALPDPAQEVFSDWTARATARADAVAAADELAQQLATN